MHPKFYLLMVGLLAFCSCSQDSPRSNLEISRQQVFETERAFAATLANRDFATFVQFLSSEAIFFSGDKSLRGAQQVAEVWQRYYEGAKAPFSWQPEKVEVLDSGTLALSTGPVFDPSGKRTATFTSIWRLEAPGKWRIIFDKGCKVCE